MNRSLSLNLIGRNLSPRKIALLLSVVCILALPFVIYWLHVDWTDKIRVYGFPGIFLLSFISSTTILLPLPGEAVLAAAPSIMGLSGGQVFWFAVVASIGGSLGELTGYLAGLWGRAIIKPKYQQTYGRVELWMKRYGSPVIFLFALTPLPFDLVGIACGSLRYPLWRFLVFCWMGRFLRALAVAYFGWSSFHLLASC